MKYKNYINSYTKDNRIYTNNEIADMSVREAFSREPELLAQNRQIGIPTEYQMQNSSNVVWVEAYTREDGTSVKGHWRSKPGHGITKYPNGKDGKWNPKEPWDEKSPGSENQREPWDEKAPGKKDELPGEDDIEETNPVSAITEIAILVLELLFPESEFVQAAKVLSPTLIGAFSKLFDGGDELSDNVEANPQASENPTYEL